MEVNTEPKKGNNRKIVGGVIVGLTLALAIFITSLFIEKIPNGYVGVVYSPNGGVQNETLDQGWHLVGLFDKVTRYPIRMQTVNYKNIQVATSDGKNITMDFAYNYSIQPDKVVSVFNKFGPVDVSVIEDSYLKTRFWDAGRKAIAKYSVIDTYGEKSSEAAVKIQEIFSEDVSDLGFIVDNLTLGVPKPDKSTQAAINKRVEAAQELERKQIELKIAQAEAEKKKIEAQGIAEYNEIIKKSISPEVIQNKWIEKWDGKMPKATGTNSLIQIPTDDKK
ncbi:regulator of protease activity HflC (stomatin/prohibitin superfamily) [Oikeobacillus pervagus]|uniref:Regulator of protease activity HflC (Stomatin/prohibitin superfamily) n=1 Tax=Oikeobacillus pervagus TaxID=1325931 RepID=A0AAJ1SXQ3_9BACI|nr:prohibitin family protein [Oikeobacillus pervagus]MDQ0214639.1 regulator of protease activity HflC (stomatin/prohibitin superfamily) [Oikeobacillus pervagus]